MHLAAPGLTCSMQDLVDQVLNLIPICTGSTER